jgi:hypothetical protein
VLKKLGAKKNAKQIIMNLTMTIVVSDSIPIIFSTIKERREEKLDNTKLLRFLQDLSLLFPPFFASSLPDLVEFIKDDEELYVKQGLIILSNCAGILAEVSPTIGR